MIDVLAGRHAAICAASGQAHAEMTVVFDAGQNSDANFAHLAGTRLRYAGPVPASDCGELTALPASARTIVDETRFGGLTALDTRREVYGRERRAILTHSPELHASQAAGFTGTTLAKATRKLGELAATLARGKTRRPRAAVEAGIGKILHDTWARRVITWQLTGDTPREHRLTWGIDEGARAALEDELFGKHVLITRPRRLARHRRHRRLPVPVRSRILLPPAQGPPRRLLLPDVPLDRAQHPGPRPHLRPRTPDRPPHAPQGRPGRPGPVSARPARPAGRHPGNRPALPGRPGPAPRPPHAHRDHPPSRTSSARSSASPATPPDAEMGNTPTRSSHYR